MKQEQVLTLSFGSSWKIWKGTTGQRNPNLKQKHKIRLHSPKNLMIAKMGLEVPKNSIRTRSVTALLCGCFVSHAVAPDNPSVSIDNKRKNVYNDTASTFDAENV